MARRSLPLLLVFILAACGGARGTDPVDGSTPSDGGTPVDGGSTGDGAVADTFQVEFTTSKGTFVVEVHRSWAPLGADHFRALVASGFYDQCRFFRIVPGFVVQFGINGTPATNAMWTTPIHDDPVMQSNTRGYVTYATSGPNTRTTQLFVNYGNNASLDSMGFAPFGIVISGMDVVDSFDAEYGEMPNQGQITSVGNSYLMSSFPNLDYIVSARIL